jgi:hypothetical protein
VCIKGLVLLFLLEWRSEAIAAAQAVQILLYIFVEQVFWFWLGARDNAEGRAPNCPAEAISENGEKAA